MEGLRQFGKDFVNIILSLILTLLISYLLFAGMLGQDYNNIASCDLWLAVGLVIFLIKYLHESAVLDTRLKDMFKDIAKCKTFSNRYYIWHFLIFLTKVMTPLATCYFIASFLLKDNKYVNIRIVLSSISDQRLLIIALLLLFCFHLVLFLGSDLLLLPLLNWYKKNTNSNRKIFQIRSWGRYYFGNTLARWILIDILFILSAAIIGFCQVFLRDINILKVHIAIILSAQTIIDYIINWKFFFNPGSIEII